MNAEGTREPNKIDTHPDQEGCIFRQAQPFNIAREIYYTLRADLKNLAPAT
jgi:hypothetical protein